MSQKEKLDINSLRFEINNIDNSLLELLSQRRSISKKVIEYKDISDTPVRDVKREQELLASLIERGAKLGLDAHFVTKIFHEIIDDSVRIQHDYLQNLANQNELHSEIVRIAIQGIEGAYSYLAAKKFFSHSDSELKFVSHKRFEEVAKSVELGDADYAMLPIENTTSGGINEVYDLLLHTPLSIVGEERFQVNHCLVGVENIAPGDIKRIYAHYQAATQCSKFVSTLPNCELEFFADTAMSVQKIKEENNPHYAAIASKQAAKVFDVKILKENIANQAENFTRFYVCARKPVKVDRRIPCKTSLVMATSHTPGSLVDALTVFRKYDLNMTKLESRPILGNPWEEMFYLDFEGNIEDDKVKKALEDLNPHTRLVKVLGSYPSQEIVKTKVEKES